LKHIAARNAYTENCTTPDNFQEEEAAHSDKQIKKYPRTKSKNEMPKIRKSGSSQYDIF
jgi:hypothetical protein